MLRYVAVLTALTIGIQSIAQAGEDRLFIDAAAEVTPEGVVLTWTVDEERAHLITGFSCVYLSPEHLRLSVNDTVPCGTRLSPAEARSRTVSELPEYGEYLFELVAQTVKGAGVGWPSRAMHVRVQVTEELAGPPGPSLAVTGQGPLVEGCEPPVGSEIPWHLDQIVSETHLTHHPGRGWIAGGDPAAEPEWPEPTPIASLIQQAGLDLATVIDKLAEAGASDAKMEDIFGEPHARAAIALAGAGTKTLLRERNNGIYELKLHTSYPFGATYRFEPEHHVPGWGDANHQVTWSEVRNRLDCPPPGAPGATHDVAFALSRDAGNGQTLAHSGYGWWTVAPIGLHPKRIVAAKAGLSFGESQATMEGTSWRGRATGHLFIDKRRWALAGDVSLKLKMGTEPAVLVGRIDNIVLTLLDAKSLQPSEDESRSLPTLNLLASSDKATRPPGEWSGLVHIATKATGTVMENLPDANVLQGDWSAAIYGPEAEEAAGHLRLWTPLPTDADPATDWPTQAVLVAGFGAIHEDEHTR